MKRLMALPALLLFFGPAAYADGPDTNFYLEAGVGQESVNHNNYSLNAVNQGVISGNATALSLVAGTGLNPNFAIEVGYHDYGQPTTGRQSGLSVSSCPQTFACPRISAVTVEAVGRFEILPDLTGEVVGGLQAWNISNAASSLFDKTSGESFIYGVRVRHDLHELFEGWSVDVTYEYSTFSTAEARIGLRYTF